MLLGFIVIALVPLSLLSLIIYGLIYKFIIKKRGEKSFYYHFIRYLLIDCILSLIYLTIFWGDFNFSVTYHHLNLKPFSFLFKTYDMGYRNMMKQIITNVIMFVPYGLLLPLVYKNLRKCYKTELIAFITSFLIEFIQYFIGRSCDIDDLIMNSIGGFIGYLLYYILNKIFIKYNWYKRILDL